MNIQRLARGLLGLNLLVGLVSSNAVTTLAAQPASFDTDSVVGSGRWKGDVQGQGVTTIEVQVTAKSGPLGEDAEGHLFFNHSTEAFGDDDFRGEVTGLAVDGTRGRVCGIIVDATNPSIIGFFFLFEFFDNGGPNDPITDQFNVQTISFINSCPPPTNVQGLPAQRGNFVIRDANP